MFKNFGKQFLKASPDNDEYVSKRIKPLHLEISIYRVIKFINYLMLHNKVSINTLYITLDD